MIFLPLSKGRKATERLSGSKNPLEIRRGRWTQSSFLFFSSLFFLTVHSRWIIQTQTPWGSFTIGFFRAQYVSPYSILLCLEHSFRSALVRSQCVFIHQKTFNNLILTCGKNSNYLTKKKKLSFIWVILFWNWVLKCLDTEFGHTACFYRRVKISRPQKWFHVEVSMQSWRQCWR